MDFLSDCSLRIPSNPVSWGVSKLFLLGYGFSLGRFCPHSYPTLFSGESASCSFWGMEDCSVRILIQPCFLGSQQAVPFWGMDFLDFSRTFAEL